MYLQVPSRTLGFYEEPVGSNKNLQFSPRTCRVLPGTLKGSFKNLQVHSKNPYIKQTPYTKTYTRDSNTGIQNRYILFPSSLSFSKMDLKCCFQTFHGQRIICMHFVFNLNQLKSNRFEKSQNSYNIDTTSLNHKSVKTQMVVHDSSLIRSFPHVFFCQPTNFSK